MSLRRKYEAIQVNFLLARSEEQIEILERLGHPEALLSFANLGDNVVVLDSFSFARHDHTGARD